MSHHISKDEITKSQAALMGSLQKAEHIIGVARMSNGDILSFNAGRSKLTDVVREIQLMQETTNELTQKIVDAIGETKFQELYQAVRKHSKEHGIVQVISDETEVRKEES